MRTARARIEHRGDVLTRAPHASYWLDGLPHRPALPPLTGSARCDVAVVGGGFTGLSTAYHVRRLLGDAEVRVLEASRCAQGSSGRSGGFVTSLFGLTKSLTALRFGRQRAIEAHRYMEDAVDFVEQMVRRHGIECGFERTGTLHVATSSAQAARLGGELRVAREWGLDHIEERGEAELAAEFPASGFVRGVFDGRSALLDPARFARGLLDLARAAGAVVHERSQVLSVRETASGFHIRSAAGELHADRVVFATNAYSGGVEGLRAKQTPVLSHVVVTERLSDHQLRSIGWGSRCGVEDARNLMHYFRLTADNRILIGGGDITPTDRSHPTEVADDAVFEHLERRLRVLFPTLDDVRVTHRWCGPVSLSTDLAPVIGSLGRGKRAWFATGLMGHGVSMAPYNGLCLAELLAGRESARTQAFFVGRRVLPWPPDPVGLPILQMARAVMKLEDRLRWD